MNVDTCWALIRAAAGQRDECEEFGRRYTPIVRRVLTARWRGSALAAEVEDAVQEVLMACFREGGALERTDHLTSGFRAYLFGITRNIALSFERARARRLARVRPGPTPDAVSWESGLARVFDREYARALVRESMDTMAKRAGLQGAAAQRRVELLRSRHEEGLPIREIATTWQADPAKLHLEQQKAIREFRSAFREVVGLSERCSRIDIDRECERLLNLLA